MQLAAFLLVVVSILLAIVVFVAREFLHRVFACVDLVEKGAREWSEACGGIEALNDRCDGLERRVSPLESDVLRLNKIDFIALGRSVDRLDDRLKGIEGREEARSKQITELTAQIGLLVKEGEGIRTMVQDMWDRRTGSRRRS